MRASDVVYARLREEIIGWVLSPGQQLGETETAERLGVSRTPLREALSRLASEGLIDTRTRTATVAMLSRRQVVELFELREALETQAARLAAKRRDPQRFSLLLMDLRSASALPQPIDPRQPYKLAGELEAAIDEAADNQFLRAALDDIRGQVARVRYHAQNDVVRLVQATTEHIQITEAILNGDEVFAMQATAMHLHRSLENVLGSIPLEA